MKRRPAGGGVLVGAAAFVLAVALWLPVLVGRDAALGGDVLYEYLPWSAEPGAHLPANTAVSDTIAQGLVWQTVVGRDLAQGILPLWNQDAGSGTPVLGNDQPGVFSPFTWMALPFPPALGFSLAMLMKLLIAGAGMAFFLRQCGTNGTAAAVGAVAFASSSFMVDWLAYPLTSVAAFTPWLFGFVEAYLSRRWRWALPGLAIAVCLQFFGGHAETSFHLGLGLGLYALIRWIGTGAWLSSLVGLAAAAVVGSLLAGIQLVPFLDLLSHASLTSIRATSGMGHQHLNLAAISSWVFPNAVGNPGIDGMEGRPPDFSESTGFAGVVALVLALAGIWLAWKRNRSAVIGLVAVGGISAALVYGLLSPLIGSLPGFQVSNNERALLLDCFCVAALAGFGLDAVMNRSTPMLRLPAMPFLATGLAGVLAVIAVSTAAALEGARVETFLPQYHHYIGFWLLTGALALLAAGSLLAAALAGASRTWAASGLCVLALTEAVFYAGTFNPREPLAQVPPPSPALEWLAAHADGRPVAALGQSIVPEAGVLYGVRDVRLYEILIDPRESTYWSAADPGFTESRAYIELERPQVDWLAAAGVAYVLMQAGQSVPGTSVVYQRGNVVIAAVPNPRPFAYAATAAVSAGSSGEAARALAEDPLGPVVVEGCCPAAGSANVDVTARRDGQIDLEVSAADRATIVVEQAYQPGWTASIDGSSTPVQAANILFMSVQVPAGHHVVKLRYQPNSVTVGAAASSVGLLGLLVLIVLATATRAPK